MPDAWEIEHFGAVEANASADPDNDGMTNAQEALFGANPNLADSDGDGFNDLDEIRQGSNPMVADGYPGSVALYPTDIILTELIPGEYRITWQNRDPWLQG